MAVTARTSVTAPAQRHRRKPAFTAHTKPLFTAHAGDQVTLDRLGFALAELQRTGVLTGARSKKLSMRVDPGLMEAARRRTGLRADADVINAALAVIAAGDDFGAWLVRQAGRLPEDFELAL